MGEGAGELVDQLAAGHGRPAAFGDHRREGFVHRVPVLVEQEEGEPIGVGGGDEWRELVELAAQAPVVGHHHVRVGGDRAGGDVTVLGVHADHRVGHDGIGSRVERQHGADLAGTAAERLRVEVTEVGVQGPFDLAEDGGGDDGLVQVVVERAEQVTPRIGTSTSASSTATGRATGRPGQV